MEKEWEKWFSELPPNVKEVAKKIVPWKKYKDKRVQDDVGNRFFPISYDEQADGSIKLTCYKFNEEIPIFGGYNVFGISPDDLVEAN